MNRSGNWEEVVSIWLAFEHFTGIWLNVPWTARLPGRRFVCVCVWNVIWSADERWHDAKMTASHNAMPGLIHLCVCVSVECDRDGKKMSQWQDVNHRQGGGLFYERQLRPSIFLFFSSVHPSFSSPPYPRQSTCALMGVWGDVNEGVGGWSRPLFISLPVGLSVYSIFYCLSFWWWFQSSWRMGIFSPPVMDWGWNLNVPSGSLYVGGRDGVWMMGWGGERNIFASIH